MTTIPVVSIRLPASKSEPHRCVAWTPTIIPGRPEDGTVQIGCGKSSVGYLMQETVPPSPWLRGFILFKAEDPIGDDVRDAYEVFLGHAGSAHCNCTGFGRWGSCKHVDALAALVAAGHLPDPRCHPGN